MEFFAMHCRREEQMKQWQTTINDMVSEAASRRAIARQKTNIQRTVPDGLKTNAANQLSGQSRYSATSGTHMSIYSLNSEVATIGGRNRYSEYNGDEETQNDNDSASEEEDLEEYIPPSCPPSGRSTPIEKRRLYKSRSLSTKFTSCTRHDGSAFVVETIRRSRSNSLPSISTTISVESLDESSPSTPVGDYPTLPMGSDKINDVRWQRDGLKGNNLDPSIPMVKLKVHFHEDIFVFQLPKTVDFAGLYEKVERKIRLCGPQSDTGALRVKYEDGDGDLVSLASTEDLQIALENGPQVTLFVT